MTAIRIILSAVISAVIAFVLAVSSANYINFGEEVTEEVAVDKLVVADNISSAEVKMSFDESENTVYTDTVDDFQTVDVSEDAKVYNGEVCTTSEQVEEALGCSIRNRETSVVIRCSSRSVVKNAYIEDNKYEELMGCWWKYIGGDKYKFTFAYNVGKKIFNAHKSGDFSTLSQEETETYFAAKEVADYVNANCKTDEEKIRFIHDYICYVSVYRTNNTYNYSATGALLKGECCCAGYADAFYLIANLSKIESYVVVGNANGGGHAWNAVYVDGEMKYMDVCWNDTLRSYEYYLISEDEMDNDHIWDKDYYNKYVEIGTEGETL